jgi:hypothetical protein
MKYQPALDVWTLTDHQRAALQIGQWVYAGDRSNMGRFYGQGRSTVVAWHNNGKRIGWRNYCRSLYDYGQTVAAKI